jgi:hypothetical protein
MNNGDFSGSFGSDSGYMQKDAIRLLLAEINRNTKTALSEHRQDLNTIFNRIDEMNKRIFTVEGAGLVLRSDILSKIDLIKSEMSNHDKDDNRSGKDLKNRIEDLAKSLDKALDRIGSLEKSNESFLSKKSLISNLIIVIGTTLTLIFSASDAGVFSFLLKLLRGSP